MQEKLRNIAGDGAKIFLNIKTREITCETQIIIRYKNERSNNKSNASRNQPVVKLLSQTKANEFFSELL